MGKQPLWDAVRHGPPRPSEASRRGFDDPEHDAQPLVGIRGWLILPAIGLPLGILLSVGGSVVTVVTIIPEVADRSFRAMLILDVVLSLAVGGLFATYAATRFFGKKRNAPSIMIDLMVLAWLQTLLMFIIYAALEANVALLFVYGRQLVLGGIAAAIWIAYFKKSQRVKATFVE